MIMAEIPCFIVNAGDIGEFKLAIMKNHLDHLGEGIRIVKHVLGDEPDDDIPIHLNITQAAQTALALLHLLVTADPTLTPLEEVFKILADRIKNVGEPPYTIIQYDTDKQTFIPPI